MAWGDRQWEGNEGSSCLPAAYPPRPLALGRSTVRVLAGRGKKLQATALLLRCLQLLPLPGERYINRS